MARTARLLRPTAARLALLCYFVGVALLWWLLPARPLVAWEAADTYLLGFLPDGQTLLTATRLRPPHRCRGPIRFWDIRSGRPVDTLLTDEDVLFPTVAIAPDGAALAWRDASHVHVVDRATHQEIASLPASPGSAFLAFSPDGGSWAYDVGRDAPARTALAVWDVAGRRERFRLEGEGAPVEFAPDGRLLVTCTPAVALARMGRNCPPRPGSGTRQRAARRDPGRPDRRERVGGVVLPGRRHSGRAVLAGDKGVHGKLSCGRSRPHACSPRLTTPPTPSSCPRAHPGDASW
jgi:hypothetical protein